MLPLKFMAPTHVNILELFPFHERSADSLVRANSARAWLSALRATNRPWHEFRLLKCSAARQSQTKPQPKAGRVKLLPNPDFFSRNRFQSRRALRKEEWVRPQSHPSHKEFVQRASIFADTDGMQFCATAAAAITRRYVLPQNLQKKRLTHLLPW